MSTSAITPPASRTTRAYPGTPDQIRAVRANLRALADGCPFADDLILCASELATNAAMHSNSRLPGATFTVRADIRPGDYAWIEVQDNGGSWGRLVADSSRNHGLGIIQALASDWGISGDYRAHTVWARLDWPSDTTGTRPSTHPQATATDIPATPPTRADTATARPLPPWTTMLDGHRLRQMRRQHGLSRVQLADQARVSSTTIARLERHPRTACRTWTLARLAAALGEHPTAITPVRPVTTLRAAT